MQEKTKSHRTNRVTIHNIVISKTETFHCMTILLLHKNAYLRIMKYVYVNILGLSKTHRYKEI